MTFVGNPLPPLLSNFSLGCDFLKHSCIHLFDNMEYSGDHWHVNPQGVCARVKLILQLCLSWNQERWVVFFSLFSFCTTSILFASNLSSMSMKSGGCTTASVLLAAFVTFVCQLHFTNVTNATNICCIFLHLYWSSTYKCNKWNKRKKCTKYLLHLLHFYGSSTPAWLPRDHHTDFHFLHLLLLKHKNPLKTHKAISGLYRLRMHVALTPNIYRYTDVR